MKRCFPRRGIRIQIAQSLLLEVDLLYCSRGSFFQLKIVGILGQTSRARYRMWNLASSSGRNGKMISNGNPS